MVFKLWKIMIEIASVLIVRQRIGREIRIGSWGKKHHGASLMGYLALEGKKSRVWKKGGRLQISTIIKQGKGEHPKIQG